MIQQMENKVQNVRDNDFRQPYIHVHSNIEHITISRMRSMNG
jgi:hypothetical protein